MNPYSQGDFDGEKLVLATWTFRGEIHRAYKVGTKTIWAELGGGFKYVLFSSLFGEMIELCYYFSYGLKPPTR